MVRLVKTSRIMRKGYTLRYVRFFEDFPVSPVVNMWVDTAARGWGEDKVYVVQTGTRIIERCILMATDPGDPDCPTQV